VSDITSMDIEWALMSERSFRSIMIQRYTPTGWWECDVAEVTDAGYLREYEIKVSRSDFKADARKSSYVQMVPGDWRSQTKKTKHELLAERWKKGPSQFFFVCPENVLPVEIVPEWAGLIYVFRRGPTHWPEERLIKPAPRLHREKVSDGFKQRMTKTFSGRYHHLLSQNYFRQCARRKVA